MKTIYSGEFVQELREVKSKLSQVERELRYQFDIQEPLKSTDRLFADVRGIIAAADELAKAMAMLSSVPKTAITSCKSLVDAIPSILVPGADLTQAKWFGELRDCARTLQRIAVRIGLAIFPPPADMRRVTGLLIGVRHKAIDVETQVERSLALLPDRYRKKPINPGLVALPFEFVV